MKLAGLTVVVVYWFIFTLLFSGVLGSPLTGYSSDPITDINSSGFTSSEIDDGGFFTGIIGIATSLGRFFLLAVFGIGLPSDTPNYIQLIFSAWQVVVTIITIAIIISAFWDG